jgi:hypothetical protein
LVLLPLRLLAVLPSPLLALLLLEVLVAAQAWA